MYFLIKFPKKDESNQISVQDSTMGILFLYNKSLKKKVKKKDTYSEITVANAAPLIPSPEKKMKIGSNMAFTKFPAAVII